MSKKKTKQILPKKSNRLLTGSIIVIISLISLSKAGFLGGFIYGLINILFGYASFIFIIYTLCFGVLMLFDNQKFIYNNKLINGIHTLVFTVYISVSMVTLYQNESIPNLEQFMVLDLSTTPGYIGYLVTSVSFLILGVTGVILVIVSLAILAIYLITSSKHFKDSKYINDKKETLKEKRSKKNEEKENLKFEKKRILEEELIASNNFEDEIELDEVKPTRGVEFSQTTIDTSSLNEAVSQIKSDDKLYSEFDNIIVDNNRNSNAVAKSNNETIALGMFDEIFNASEIKGDVISEMVEEKSYETQNDNQIHDTNEIHMRVEDEFNVHIPTEKSLSEVKPIARRNRKYQVPSIKILSEYQTGTKIYKELEVKAKEKAKLLLATLASFNLNVKIANIIIGPSITMYELEPEIGVKVSRFNSVTSDIALALAATSIRIEAPIPGKSLVGIEVPNEKIQMISLREVLLSPNNDVTSKLQVGLGKDINGVSTFLDINKTPHMLVAGSTGSGKSVCINSIIVSILLKCDPTEVNMVMIDPKKVELTPYNDIPHLLTPVVTDPKKASLVLAKMVQEMEYRYELFAKTNTRNIATYNEKVKTNPDISFKTLPFIVIIVDELADLMMVASNEVETSIARIAQMARACGMHLIIATQRPSTDVITGLIKSNIPTRIAFAVSSSIDSRTILDRTGAEKLLGKGDMLLSEAGSPVVRRIQGAFLTDDEIYKVVEKVKSQFNIEDVKNNYSKELNEDVLERESSIDELDELYEDIKTDVINMQKASASYIQRKYKVGYNRAVRIMDQLEENNIISENEGTKPRKVLVDTHDDIN